jgi:uncharacterized ferritin-like protein (DUF455 family)
MQTSELREKALYWLSVTDANEKAQGVLMLRNVENWHIQTHATLVASCAIPGRPQAPLLVSPKSLEKRSMRTVEGRAALVHALCHIEFNAINLALDAIWRFSDMPAQYYLDWLKVAIEESDHFLRLKNHLIRLGFDYGSFSGHNSLWEMVEKTQGDVLARMALVPRTLEARGLDACPALRNKLAQVGDDEAAKILDIILHDEIGHVAIGNHWFHWLCKARELEPIQTFARLSKEYKAPTLKPPFNWEARKKAGFSEAELAYLDGEFF